MREEDTRVTSQTGSMGDKTADARASWETASPRRRVYNRWVADESMEDFALRFTARRARRWSYGRVANTALGSISFLALEAIGATITLTYGFDVAVVAIMVVGAIIFLTGLPISYYAARYGVDIDLLSRGAGFGYVGSTVTSLIYATFTFIFFAIEAAILALALEFCLGLPLWLSYIVSSIVIIPIVMKGFRKLSAFQYYTQPLWIILHLVPLGIVLWAGPQLSVWTEFSGLSHKEELSFVMVAAASGMVFALVAQIGEQVDYLRFLPEPKTRAEHRRWWAAMIAAGPGWSVVGVAKMLFGSFLATLLIAAAYSPGEAVDATRMYHYLYDQIIAHPVIALAVTALFVILSQLKINVTNAYAGSIAWSNFFSRITHNHPGRVVWLFFNVAIATLLAMLGILSVLEHVLTVYSHVALAWIGALTADLVINKRVGLSPEGIEFRRAHLYDINPVGAGAMGLGVVGSYVAYAGLLGETVQVFSTFIALGTAFIVAPLIAWGTRGKYYLAKNPEPVHVAPSLGREGTRAPTQTCSVCNYRFDPEDMTQCPFYNGPICSLCCTLEGSCRDMCRPNATLTMMTDRAFRRLLPQKAVAFIYTQPVRVALWSLLPTILLFSALYTIRETAGEANFNAVLMVIFVISLVTIGIVTWSLILFRENRDQALDDAEMQAQRLRDEIAAHEVTDAALQEAKEKAEAANLAKTRYMAGISHELRTPLNAIYGFSQLLEADQSIPADRRRAVQAIRRGSEHLAGLIENLLDISKIEAGRLEINRDQIRFRALCDQVATIFTASAAKKGIEFQTHISKNFPDFVYADEKRLRQILINLLSNALRYTDEGRVQLDVQYRNQVAVIRVIDTGIGIPTDQLDRIWKPFERVCIRENNPMSSGLGLTITKLLVEILGGEISVHSAPGQGSTFQCKLLMPDIQSPALVPKDTPSGSSYANLRYDGPRKTLLAVDDDRTHLDLMEALFNPLGFNVITQSSPLSAKVLLSQTTPDLIFLDIDMPGMSGWDLVRHIRAIPHLRQVPICMISAHALEAHNQRSHINNDQIDAFLIKPFSVNDLLARIADLLKIRFFTAQTSLRPDNAPAASDPGLLMPQRLSHEEFHALDAAIASGHIAGIRAMIAEFDRDERLSPAHLATLVALLDQLDLPEMHRFLQAELSPLQSSVAE